MTVEIKIKEKLEWLFDEKVKERMMKKVMM